jgi:predicted GNAT family acetyltransferase
MAKGAPVSLVRTLVVLTLVSGLVDAVCYLGLGRVFTANMTGNVVVLGFAAAGAPGFSVPATLTSLAVFLVGAVCASRMAGRIPASKRARLLLAVVAAGAAFGLSPGRAELDSPEPAPAPDATMVHVNDAPQVTDNQAESRFELSEDGHLAELDYRLNGKRLVLIHTETPVELEGRGLGGRLVAAAVDRAKREGLTVVPLCPFARGWLERHGAEAADVTIDWGRPG